MKVSDRLREDCKRLDGAIAEDEKRLEELEKSTKKTRDRLATCRDEKAKLLEAINLLEDVGK